MIKSKKTLTMLGVYVLVIALAITGTIAYLTSTDSDVNVMTLGNVKIQQNEKERVDAADHGTLTEDQIQDFKQSKPLYPYVDENLNHVLSDDYEEVIFPDGNTYQVLIGDNAIDKFVSVTNTGKSAAYVRTLLALEAPTDKMDIILNTNDWMIDQSVSNLQIVIDGVTYDLLVCIYKEILEPGQTTPNNLMQVALRWDATNEDVKAYGDSYDVFVLSQAVQTNGFDKENTEVSLDAQNALNEAFGEVNASSAASWFHAIPVPGMIKTATQAYDSTLENGVFTLASDIYTTDTNKHYSNNREYAIRDAIDYTLNLNGHTIHHNSTYQDGNNTGYTYLYTVAYDGKLTVNGDGVITSKNAEGSTAIFYAQRSGEITLNGGEFYVDCGMAVWAGNGSHVIINDGTYISSTATDQELIYSSGGIIDIYGGFFHNEGWESRPVNVANANRSTGFINIYGGTFVNFDPSSGGDDPSNIKVMDGYKVVAETQTNGDVWYRVVAE